MNLLPAQRNVLSDFYLHVAEGAALALVLNQFQPVTNLGLRTIQACVLFIITCTFILFAVEFKVGRSRYG